MHLSSSPGIEQVFTPTPAEADGGLSFVRVGEVAETVGAQLLCRRDRAVGSLRLARHVIRALDRGQPVDAHVVAAALDSVDELLVSFQ